MTRGERAKQREGGTSSSAGRDLAGMTKDPRPEDGATGLRCKFDRHPRIVVGGKQGVNDNYLSILMRARFVTPGREVARSERLAGRGDSNELWKNIQKRPAPGRRRHLISPKGQ